MHGWPRKCVHHYCCLARRTHFDRHQPAYSQFSCALSVIACLFNMYTCGCVHLYALKLLACCARYSALRRSLPHLTRAALLTAMRLRPLCTVRCLYFNALAQRAVRALKGLACRMRFIPASTPASHCIQSSTPTSASLRVGLRQSFSRTLTF